jgi:hypothetical protein
MIRFNPLRKLLPAAFFLMLTWGASVVWAGNFDTSFAVENSYSCLTGGCHETNTTLMDGYKASYMTHTMVKCNACHGTHTAAELGAAKPNLTGYVAGMGATGYKVPKDRCVVCHSAASGHGHPNNPGECLSCHAPHQFAR